MARKQGSENKVVVSGTAAAPARRKAVSTKRVARPTTVEISNAPESEAEVATTPAATESFREAVAALAFSYWEARGCQGGSPEADWLRAEHELSAK